MIFLQSATDFACDATAELLHGRIIPFPSVSGHAAFPIVATRLTLRKSAVQSETRLGRERIRKRSMGRGDKEAKTFDSSFVLVRLFTEDLDGRRLARNEDTGP
ncbi:hypothetical protein EAG_05363 [Camponotus floridanus]|uniref:Uncharacterized protein n=1 Tax=Camponotus floridanus TaxID=104421 RepID=E2B109_CAMFO|nr:hypothetical protein EAG_05363 [Camponotus floridanus]